MKYPIIALLGTALLLSGCGRMIKIVVQAETERLADLRAWEANLAEMDCGALDEEYSVLVKKKDDMTDFDQRQDIMRDTMTEKSCALPEDLA